MESVQEFRVSLTVGDFNESVAFYRSVLGLPIAHDWSTSQGRCILLQLPKATLELIDQAQAQHIDDVEVGRRLSGQVRLAFQFLEVNSALATARTMGATVVRQSILTPWRDLISRVRGPDGMQITFFQSPPSTGP